ncbi:MAG TPA: class I SAM-dependent methyltransferase [Mobilitalea sp.]|nr:class I SAM-dependent methyltransferase [Mobilitalea sp.]
MNTIDYYNRNARLYFDSTVELSMGEIRDKFIALLPEGAEILDLGCGSGRDSLYFIERGLNVTALDGSKELCRLASIHIDQDVLHMLYSDLDFKEVFNGVWACASLLHCSQEELKDVFIKVIDCLKPGGILYMSFQYGEFAGLRNGRYYMDFKTRKMKEFLSDYGNIKIIEIWKSSDIREDRDNDVWLNILVRTTDEEEEE